MNLRKKKGKTLTGGRKKKRCKKLMNCREKGYGVGANRTTIMGRLGGATRR